MNQAKLSVEPAASTPTGAQARKPAATTPSRNYFVALVACAITTAIATPLREHFDLANIVMVFLLTVVLVGVRLGRGPAVLASFVSVAAFDFFFVPPRFSFTVDDPQYLLTFAVMLVVALIVGHLTADLKRQATDARLKEKRSHALYEMARELAGAATMVQVTEISRRFLRAAIDAQMVFLLPDETGKLELAGNGDNAWSQPVAALMVKLAYENTACTDIDAEYPVGYFPLKAPTRMRGVMAVASPVKSVAPLSDHHEFLETVASLIAIAVERLHFADSAQRC